MMFVSNYYFIPYAFIIAQYLICVSEPRLSTGAEVEIASAFGFVNGRSNNSSSSLSEGYSADNVTTVLGEEGTVPGVQLVKCHCPADHLYHNDLCVPGNTTVQIITSFTPFTVVSVATNALRVNVESLSCAGGYFRTEIEHHVLHILHTTGQLFNLETGDTFSANEYCIEHYPRNGEAQAVAFVCQVLPEVPLCCPLDEFLNVDLTCQETSTTKPFLPVITNGNLRVTVPLERLVVREGHTCPDENVLIPIHHTPGGFSLQYRQAEAFLQVDQDNYTIYFDSAHYCISQRPSSGEQHFAAFVCTETSTTCDQSTMKILQTSLLLSSLFLILSLCLFFFLSKLQPQGGRSIIICHILSLLIGFLLLLLHRMPVNINCRITGPLIQISFLATFFWLNVMCFDIWWILRWKAPVRESRQQMFRRFLKYSVYAWGMPLVIGACSVTADNLKPDLRPNWFVVPGMGKDRCWFNNWTSGLIYFYGVVGFLMTSNLVFFIWVVVILVRANRTFSKVLNHNGPEHRGRAFVYMKLFGVMGVTWIFEVVSWREENCYYWLIVDVINSLRGVIIFGIFFVNKSFLRLVQENSSLALISFRKHLDPTIAGLRRLSRTVSSHDSGVNDSKKTSSSYISKESNSTHENSPSTKHAEKESIP